MDELAKSMLKCTICKQPLKEPKTLPCKHMFCKVCLQGHCLKSASDDQFCCPQCSSPVQISDPNAPVLEWVDSLPTNHQIDTSLATMLVGMGDEQSQNKCAPCLQKWKPSRAVKYCRSCQEYFCDECGNQHWLLQGTKEHRVWLLEDLATLKQDPLIRANLEMVFSGKQKARNKRRSSVYDRQTTEAKTAEEEDCDITGACFLDGRLVLADKGNMRLTFFNDSFVSQAVYRTGCYDIVDINEYFLAATCPEEQCLKIISVYNHVIEEDRKISFTSECYGVCRVGNTIAVALASKPISINIYDGSVLKSEIKLDHGKLPMRKPRYITYHEDTDRFFVSDNMAGCLKSVDQEGNIVWEKRIDMCNGLASFRAYILIARSDKNTVDLLNPNGQILKSIVTPDDGLSNVRVLGVHERNGDSEAPVMAVVDCAEFVHVFGLCDPLSDDDMKPVGHKDRDRRQSALYKQGRSKSCAIL